ncbi:hypothetical protein A2392_02110 [Candidatus Kaiserbacteria bacterium RIFOXYB1_FULL_46_14]|uniref:Uncharacterized protein n=1 Tax=Candidatus Kaiserbacteria bacterium RIFOXYB1_FULL_46_14 TaxID=1798531 RepID=A0A1F6FI55_9BACT|nr:MAG: hypothetical protein A2392_02110 [Candidatus Kaiserbacteria bacterium RIFOXYB1_FULL_46_14]
MVQNKEKYLKAREFRQRGFSYSEIAKIVGVSKSTVSNWFAKQSFSKKVRKDNEIKARRDNVKRVSLVNKARKAERTSHYKEAVKSAETEFKHFKSAPLFLAGLSIYMADGDLVHPSQIRLPSQRPHVHKIFIKFLKEFLGVERSLIYSKPHLTITNDVIAKKKLLWWIDRLPRIVLNS